MFRPKCGTRMHIVDIKKLLQSLKAFHHLMTFSLMLQSHGIKVSPSFLLKCFNQDLSSVGYFCV